MTELKIVGWTHFDCEYPTRKLKGEDLIAVYELIQEEIVRNQYVFSGQEHQCDSTGVPVFSDGTCFRASMRSWGKLMASLYSGPNGEELSYMDFYMSLGEDSVMPEYSDINVEPAVLDDESIGCITKEDKQIVQESLSLGMTFLTTDKVLEKLAEKMKEEK